MDDGDWMKKAVSIKATLQKGGGFFGKVKCSNGRVLFVYWDSMADMDEAIARDFPHLFKEKEFDKYGPDHNQILIDELRR